MIYTNNQGGQSWSYMIKDYFEHKINMGKIFDKIMDVSITSVTKIKLLDLIVDYYSLHLQRFSKIKSLPILHEVFRET